MKSIYANNVIVGMGEIGRLVFQEITVQAGVEVSETVSQIAIPVEVLRNLYLVIGQTIKAFDENIAKQAETNKGMN